MCEECSGFKNRSQFILQNIYREFVTKGFQTGQNSPKWFENWQLNCFVLKNEALQQGFVAKRFSVPKLLIAKRFESFRKLFPLVLKLFFQIEVSSLEAKTSNFVVAGKVLETFSTLSNSFNFIVEATLVALF